MALERSFNDDTRGLERFSSQRGKGLHHPVGVGNSLVSGDSLPPAVVLGLDPNGLGIVKSLRKAGIPVIGVERAPLGPGDSHIWMSSRTRYCRKVMVHPDSCPGGFLKALTQIAGETDTPLPVIPSGDDFLLFLAENSAELSPSFRFHVPDQELLELLMHKGRFYEFCLENDISFPQTLQVGKGDAPGDLVRDLQPPYLVKPQIRDHCWNQRYPQIKALTAESREELMETLADAEETGCELLVQEIIPGPDSDLYFFHGYFSGDSDAVALWTGRKLRQYPPRLGTSTLVEAVWVPEVADISKRIAKALGLRGYLNVEFKLDRRDGKFKLIEVTPSRTWYPHYLGVALGINLPELWYRDLLGLPLKPPLRDQGHRRVAWVDEYRDFVAAFEARERGELNLSGWIRSYRNVRSFALFSPWDPVPGLLVGVRLGLSFLNWLKRKPQPGCQG